MSSHLLASPLRIARRFSLIALALAAGMSAMSLSAARADEPAKADDAEALFKQLDANSDGQLTREEIPSEKQGLARRLFRSGDANDDGQLSREEFVAALGPRPDAAEGSPRQAARDRLSAFMQADPDAFFRRADANGDGKVTPDEVPEERRERFTTLLGVADTDGNGGLDREEFLKVRERFAGAAGEGAGRRPGRTGQEQGERPDRSGISEAVFHALDKDGDGKLSADEIKKAADSLAALDKNGDGSITAAELEGGRRGGLAGGAGFDPDRAWRRLLNGDKNNDGKLSEDELPERLQQAFGRLDKNGDGYVDETEVKDGLAKLRSAAGRNQ